MKTRFLFPYWCRFLGYACIVFHIPIILLGKTFDFDFHNIPDEPGLFNHHHLFFMATSLLMLIGLVLVAFAKEKVEDEQISQLRLDSLQWAIYLNYFILIVTLVFTGRQDYQDILQLNLWIPLVFFIIRFRWMIFRLNRSVKEDIQPS
jgi:cell division protein FtsW (lipid II flippase)